MGTMKFDTALREYVLERVAEIGGADLLVGIPTYDSEETIVGVMSAVYTGLEKYYPDARSVLFVSDTQATVSTLGVYTANHSAPSNATRGDSIRAIT